MSLTLTVLIKKTRKSLVFMSSKFLSALDNFLSSIISHTFCRADNIFFLFFFYNLYYVQAIDRLPLIPGVLELVGIGYTGVSYMCCVLVFPHISCEIEISIIEIQSN